MSKKIREEERQQSLENFFTSKCTKGKTGKTAEQVTPVPLKVSISTSAKRRTPPSIESELTYKKLPKQRNPEMPNHVLFEEVPERKDMEVEITDTDTTPKTIMTDTDPQKDEEEELPRKTILCMKKAMQELIDPLEEKINQLLDTKKLQEDQAVEITHLKDKQSELYRKCLKIENENNILKHRLQQLESTMLEGNIIMHGLREEEWELDSNRRERIYHAIASTVDTEDRRARLDIARSIPIRSSRRLGKYKTSKNRPISIAFEKKAHADILFQSKSWLPCGVYIDREYTQEVENKRKLLRPILKLACSIEKYQGKCKLEEE